MKKLLTAALCALMALCLLTGCAKQDSKKLGQADNEILTYEKIDPSKTTLVVARSGNIWVEGFAKAFESRNPDVQVICLDITGGNSMSRPLLDWIKGGLAPDVLFCTTDYVPDGMSVEYFEDLSANPIVASYQAEALNRETIDAKVYWLPGPSNIECMLYNKTLFERYGWEVPQTFDQFVALGKRITEDTDGAVQPWNPNAKYSNEFMAVTEAFVYEESFGGLENRRWYQAFCSQESADAEHLRPYFQAVKTLTDAGLLKEEHFTYSATTRGKEFSAGQIAMINGAVAIYNSDEFEFDYMPFPTTTGESGYIIDTISCTLGVPKKERTKAVQSAVDRFVQFFSSVEGQQAYIGDLLMMSNVKGVPLSQAEHLASLKSAIDQGHTFTRLDFRGPYNEPKFSLNTHAQNVSLGKETIDQCIASINEAGYAPTASQTELAHVAEAAEDFTILETSNFIADMYRDKAGADIGLIANGQAYRGNLMRIFTGELTADHVTVLKPRSLANGSTLVKAAMTGAQLLDALNHPMEGDNAVNSIYAFSGLKCKVAPWNELGKKYLSVALADGTAIDPAKTYTVAFWDGTVDGQYITEVLETYEGKFEELLTAWLTEHDPVKPAKDGRIELIWE